jgi:hypothetical protein
VCFGDCDYGLFWVCFFRCTLCLVSEKMEGNKNYKVVFTGFSFEDLKLLFSVRVSVCFGVFMCWVVLFC